MKKKYRDNDGNLYYKCWSCKEEFNFKAMRCLTENKDSQCPNCDKKIKL